MRPTHPIRLLALCSLAPFLSSAALAQAPDSGYLYGGIGVGNARGKLDAESIAREQAGVAATGVERDDRDTAYRLFLGYQFHRILGVEFGYFRLGTFGFDAVTTPGGTLAARSNIQGFNLDLVGTMPLSERWSALGRVGAQFARTRTTLSATGAAAVLDPAPSERHTDYKVGAGLQYAFSPSFMLRGEAERYRVNDAVNHKLNVDVLSVSLVFPVGRAVQPAVRAMAPVYVAPAYVAPAAAPEPVAKPPEPLPVAVTPPPAPAVVPLKRVSFSAESLYGFDKSTLQPAGREALDGFARELEGMTFDRITVEGHTDRLGTPAYNQTLSQERADAVKFYLVTSGKVDPMKITAVGKGEANPVTLPEACKGSVATAELIGCLQPDRRVEIEVSGTR
jgi:OOP family OmpA-OmpF porin